MKRDLEINLIVGMTRLPVELDLEEVTKAIIEAEDPPVKLMTDKEKKIRDGVPEEEIDDTGSSGSRFYFDEGGKYNNDFLTIFAGKTTDGGSIQVNYTGDEVDGYLEEQNLILDLLEYIGVEFDRDECTWEIHNMLVQGHLPCHFSQRKLKQKLGANSTYMAEDNAAVRYEYETKSGNTVTFQIFKRGKFSILSANSTDEVLEAIDHLIAKLREVYDDKLPDEEIDMDFKFNRRQNFC
jgi:TATA-box binding protein (TBP) (component of TFIID and TFIIIB)